MRMSWQLHWQKPITQDSETLPACHQWTLLSQHRKSRIHEVFDGLYDNLLCVAFSVDEQAILPKCINIIDN